MRTTILSAAVALVVFGWATPPVDAVLVTVYEENFNDNDAGKGVTGPVPPNADSFNEGNWSIDASMADVATNNEFAKVQGGATSGTFTARGLGDGMNTGFAVFTTSVVSIAAPSGFFWSTLSASFAVSNLLAGDSVLVESVVDNVVVDSSTLNVSAGLTTFTHNLKSIANMGGTLDYQLRVTFTQLLDAGSNATLDNILVEGRAIPEPASMAMVGMGIVSMFGAGYRRKRRQARNAD